MTLWILDENLNSVKVVDVYKSFIWTDRYNEKGDFELYIPMGFVNLSDYRKEYYLWNSDSEHLMILESLNISSDTEEDVCLAITGQSLESLLTRRVVWKKTSFKATGSGETRVKPNLQNGIKKLLNDNIINPEIPARKINNFVFEASDDPRITSLTFEAQYFGEDLYTIIHNLCVENDIGFKITLNSAGQFVFKLYKGIDRSYAQTVNPYVIFSPKYDNLISSSYLDSIQTLKNVALVAGESIDDPANEDETIRETYVVNTLSDITGIHRREIYVDASGISRDMGEEDKLTEEQYQAHLRQKGIDALIENCEIEAFEGEVNDRIMYKYGQDYFLGDVVQIVNEYGHEGRAYVSEFIMSYDQQGLSVYPTFINIQKGVYDYE
jgi:hypothetical protein